jgi:ATP/maltotriose-dependent transcriptional regulator MalT
MGSVQDAVPPDSSLQPEDRTVRAVELPLLESKLHVPRRRRGVVPRARLEQRLDRSALPPMVLVSAPAGSGKTTLLAEWLATGEAAESRTAWLSLDRRDRDPRSSGRTSSPLCAGSRRAWDRCCAGIWQGRPPMATEPPA